MGGAHSGLRDEQRTCLPTLYGKALDAQRPDSILGDTLAAEAVHAIDFDFRSLRLPRDAAVTLPIRAKHLDGWTAEFLARHPHATVLNLGCGLDTRVYRMDPPPGVHWYDIDAPAVLDLRRELYPPRPGYRMIAASVTDPAWLADLDPDRPVAVVAEGLLPYLDEAAAIAQFARITRTFPSGQFAFDAYSRLLNRVLTVGSRAFSTGVHLRMAVADPQALAEAVGGLTLSDAVPFLTMPELLDRLARTRRSRALYRALGRSRLFRDSIRHLRYRFGDPNAHR